MSCERRAPRSTDESYLKFSWGTTRSFNRRASSLRRNQPGRGLLDRVAVPHEREINLGMGNIGGNLNVRERNHAHPRILELHTDNIREFALDLLSDAPASGKISRHRQWPVQIPARIPNSKLATGNSKLEGARDFDNLVGLELVTHLQIVVVLEREPALETSFHLAGVILEAPQ